MQYLPFLTLLAACAVSPPPRVLDLDTAIDDLALLNEGDDGGVPPDDDPDPDPDTDVVEQPDPVEIAPLVVDGVVCFPGPDRLGDLCLDLVLHDDSWGAGYDYRVSSDSRYPVPARYQDLSTADPSTPISPNFILEEFMEARKGRFGVLQPKLVWALQSMRDAVGGAIHVNSGYRNQLYNAGVGGAGWSRHLYGDAADLQSPSATLDELGDLCAAEGAGYIGWYETHVHCDWRDTTNETVLFEPPVSSVRPGPVPSLHRAEILRGAVWTAPAVGWDEGEPLREWTALDARGVVLARGSGVSFVPPAHAARVEVWVGRRVLVGADLP